MNLSAATERQQSYIASLLEQRECGSLLDGIEILSPRDASRVIDILKAAPKKSNGQRSANPLATALEPVPNSKYAIRIELISDFLDETVRGDLLFVEVRTYNGHKYLRRLHGSVGSFTRTKLSLKDSLTVLGILAQNPYEHAKLFGQHYACCARCGAELTDETSRSLMLGPDCRKAFGF